MSFVVGLTGQTGSGKTSVCKIFRENDFAVIDCDKAAREVTSSGSECCKKLSEVFPHCFDENFTLDRKALGNIVFSDKSSLEVLNRIIFSYIIPLLKKKINEAQDKNYILLDAPTLFEANADKLCDVIVSVVADEKIRLERIMKRDNLTQKQACDRMSSQYSEDFFRNNSDYVITNNGDLKNA